MLDAEIVYLDSEGHSQFNPLFHKRGDPCFYAFDLLWLNGCDLRQRPLIERKALLRAVRAYHVSEDIGSNLARANHFSPDRSDLRRNPPNAMLNYLYGLLESAARLALAALGPAPGLGFIHVDTPARDSLACDLMEAVRLRWTGMCSTGFSSTHSAENGSSSDATATAA